MPATRFLVQWQAFSLSMKTIFATVGVVATSAAPLDAAVVDGARACWHPAPAAMRNATKARAHRDSFHLNPR